MAQSQADLDAALTTLVERTQSLTTAVTANSAAIAALLAKIGGNPDFSAEVAAVASADQAVKDAIAAIAADDAKA